MLRDAGIWYCSQQCIDLEAQICASIKGTRTYQPLSQDKAQEGLTYKLMRGKREQASIAGPLQAGYNTLRDGLDLRDSNGKDVLKQLVYNYISPGGFCTLNLRSEVIHCFQPDIQ